MSIPSELLYIGKQKLMCRVQEGHPVVELDGRTYDDLQDLLENLMDKPTEHLQSLAKLITFLGFAGGFEALVDKIRISNFCSAYEKSFKLEDEGTGSAGQLKDYGKFDVKVIQPPKIQEGRLIFYVRQQEDRIPYRAEIPFPPDPGSPIRITRLDYTKS